MNKWKTKDGTVLNIKDMETSHILNCINLLERKAQYIRNAITYSVPDPWDEIDSTGQLEMRIGLEKYEDGVYSFKRELNKRK